MWDSVLLWLRSESSSKQTQTTAQCTQWPVTGSQHAVQCSRQSHGAVHWLSHSPPHCLARWRLTSASAGFHARNKRRLHYMRILMTRAMTRERIRTELLRRDKTWWIERQESVTSRKCVVNMLETARNQRENANFRNSGGNAYTSILRCSQTGVHQYRLSSTEQLTYCILCPYHHNHS